MSSELHKINARRWGLIPLFLFLLVFPLGCNNEINYINLEKCRETGTYCHLIVQDNGTAYLNFSATGNFNYTVGS